MSDTSTSLIARAFAELQAAQAQLSAAEAAQKRALNALSTALKSPEEPGSGAASEAALPSNPHIAQHKPGVPFKIESDPELEAFLTARMFSMGFVQLAAAVAENFPPERRVGKSTIHAWWARNLRSVET